MTIAFLWNCEITFRFSGHFIQAVAFSEELTVLNLVTMAALVVSLQLLFTARKAEGTIFTRVCHSVHREGVGICHRDSLGQRPLNERDPPPPSDRDPPPGRDPTLATTAGGTHPIRMHTCYF